MRSEPRALTVNGTRDASIGVPDPRLMRQKCTELSAMVVGHDYGRIESDASPDGAQTIVEHLIFQWKIAVRKSADPSKDLRPVRRIVWREIGRVRSLTAR